MMKVIPSSCNEILWVFYPDWGYDYDEDNFTIAPIIGWYDFPEVPDDYFCPTAITTAGQFDLEDDPKDYMLFIERDGKFYRDTHVFQRAEQIKEYAAERWTARREKKNERA